MLHATELSASIIDYAVEDHYLEEEAVVTLDRVGDDWSEFDEDEGNCLSAPRLSEVDLEAEQEADTIDFDCDAWIPYEAITALGIDLSIQLGKDRSKRPKLERFAQAYADIVAAVHELREHAVARILTQTPRSKPRRKFRKARLVGGRRHVRTLFPAARAEDRVLIEDVVDGETSAWTTAVKLHTSAARGMRMLTAPGCPLQSTRQRLPDLLAKFERAVLDVQEDSISPWASRLAYEKPHGRPQVLLPVDPLTQVHSFTQSFASSVAPQEYDVPAAENIRTACAKCEQALVEFGNEAAIYEEIQLCAAEEEMRIAAVDEFLSQAQMQEVEGASLVPVNSPMPVGSPAAAARLMRKRSNVQPVVFHFEDDSSVSARESSLTRGYEALGAEFHTLDEKMESWSVAGSRLSRRVVAAPSAIDLDLGSASSTELSPPMPSARMNKSASTGLIIRSGGDALQPLIMTKKMRFRVGQKNDFSAWKVSRTQLTPLADVWGEMPMRRHNSASFIL